jgi:hypothetical protein
MGDVQFQGTLLNLARRVLRCCRPTQLRAKKYQKSSRGKEVMTHTVVAGDVDQSVETFALPQRLYHFWVQTFSGRVDDCDGAFPLKAAV